MVGIANGSMAQVDETQRGCISSPADGEASKDSLMMATPRFVSAEEIRKILSFPTLIAALEVEQRRPKMEVQNCLLGNEKAQYFVRHAVDRGRYMASKLVTSFPANLRTGALPAVQALCVLFDGCNGRPLVVIDGTHLAPWRP